MFSFARISIYELMHLCRRLAIAIEAGIDARTVWARESQRTSGRTRARLAIVSQKINQGESLYEALGVTGEFFPLLFRELVKVGEQTGRLDVIFSRLADHYENRLTLRRQFWSSITWPLTELALALVFIGFLIWIMGLIRDMSHSNIEPLGIGLYGIEGLAMYLLFLLVVAGLIWYIIYSLSRGLAWTRPIQQILLSLPGLGQAWEKMALSRLAWSLNLTFDAGMAVRHAIHLSLGSTNYAWYTEQIEFVDREIERGSPIYEAFAEAGCFPVDFLHAVEVGEEGGKLVEAMDGLSRQYQEQARYAFKTINTLAAFGVWMLIAAFMVFMIFRFALSYIGMLNQLVG